MYLIRKRQIPRLWTSLDRHPSVIVGKKTHRFHSVGYPSLLVCIRRLGYNFTTHIFSELYYEVSSRNFTNSFPLMGLALN